MNLYLSEFVLADGNKFFQCSDVGIFIYLFISLFICYANFSSVLMLV